jgi:hypothetical protein
MKVITQKKTVFTLGFAVLVLLAQSALADFIPLPVKWSQPIGFNPTNGLIIGKDRLSDHTAFGPNGGVVRADDFICNTPLPIVAVRWWGSYIGEGPATGSTSASIFRRPTDSRAFLAFLIPSVCRWIHRCT